MASLLFRFSSIFQTVHNNLVFRVELKSWLVIIHINLIKLLNFYRALCVNLEYFSNFDFIFIYEKGRTERLSDHRRHNESLERSLWTSKVQQRTKCFDKVYINHTWIVSLKHNIYSVWILSQDCTLLLSRNINSLRGCVDIPVRLICAEWCDQYHSFVSFSLLYRRFTLISQVDHQK